jgi:hypothetical protein
MKRISVLLSTIICLCFVLVAPVFAQGTNITTGQDTSSSVPLLGNDHSYSVTVKASGMLVVNARIVISNSSAKAKTDFKFSGLGATQGKITGYQQIKGRQCRRPDYNANKCLEYEEPDYIRYAYYDNYNEPSTYKPLEITNEGEVISGKLPVAVESYKSTAIVLSYYLSEQTTNGLFGQKRFDFSSLQDEDLVKEVSVSVDTDSDLYVKGEKSKVSAPSGGSSGMLAVSSTSISSKAFDSAVSNIGSYGGWMNKTGKDIVPGESFKVSGSYSTSWFGLYWKAVLIALLIIALIVLGIWWLARKKPSSTGSNDAGNNLSSGHSASSANMSLSFRQAATMRNFLASFLVGICVILAFIGGVFLFTWIASAVGYSYEVLVWLSGVVLAFLLIGFAIGYPIYLGVKKGLNMALVCIISYIAAIIISVAVGIVLVGVFSNDTGSSPTSYPGLKY